MILSNTISNIPCYYLRITSSKELDKKLGVIMTARVHPGETVSSFMMKGSIDFLISDDPQAERLRDLFVFYIVPMLNPDGVIVGNYRCSLDGSDLNRNFRYPSKVRIMQIFHEHIAALKKIVSEVSKQYSLVFYFDMHGHSRSRNVFVYGNTDTKAPQQYKIFPFVLSKICPYFSFQSSKFSVHKSKYATARVTFWKELQVSNIFTIEESFFGPEKNNSNQIEHFIASDYSVIGKRICQALLICHKLSFNFTPSFQENKDLKESKDIKEKRDKEKNKEPRCNSPLVIDDYLLSTIYRQIQCQILKPILGEIQEQDSDYPDSDGENSNENQLSFLFGKKKGEEPNKTVFNKHNRKNYEKSDKIERVDRIDKIDKIDRIDKIDKIDKIEKIDKNENCNFKKYGNISCNPNQVNKEELDKSIENE